MRGDARRQALPRFRVRFARKTRTLSDVRIPVALAALLGLSCRAADPPRPCPARFALDPPRAAALADRLATVPEGASVLTRAQGAAMPRICFGPAIVSSITTDGAVLLDGDLGEPEAAARLGHLLAHVVEGLPMARPGAGDCEAQVEDALRKEARALALELRLRHALGVTERRIPYAFEDDVQRAPPEARERLVLDYLRAHPDGAPGLDGLASGYARRCRR